MKFRALPIDLLRLILDRLEFNDYVRLYNTLDKGIHQSFSFARVFTEIHVYVDDEVSRLDAFNLLAIVRNVSTLTVDKSLKWPPHLLRLLTTLNPLQLRICASPLDASAADIVHRYLEEVSDQSERRIARLLTPSLLPKFSRLTPQLEHLELYDPSSNPLKRGTFLSPMLDTPWNDDEPFQSRLSYYRFPLASLTSFTIECVSTAIWDAMSASLPVSLRKLSLQTNYSLDLASLVDSFPMLEDLYVGVVQDYHGCPSWKSTNSEGALPQSLLRFAIATRGHAQLWLLLEHCKLVSSNVTTLEIHASEHWDNQFDLELDLRLYLPPSITKALIHLPLVATVLNLPTSLTALDLVQNFLAPQLGPILPSLTHLTTLHLKLNDRIDITGSRDRRYVAKLISGRSILAAELKLFQMLPKTLTRLSIEGGCDMGPSSAAIEDLPPKLRSLSLPYLNLAEIDILSKHLPSCYLTISEPIELWSSTNGRFLRSSEVSPLWSPVIDLDAWIATVARHYIQLHAQFVLKLAVPYKKLKLENESCSVETLCLTSDLLVRIESPTTKSRHDIPQLGRVFVCFPNLRKLILVDSSTAASPAGSWTLQHHGTTTRQLDLPLSALPPSMTYLEVFDAHIRILLDSPTAAPNLSFIATNTTCSIPKGLDLSQLKLLPNLMFLAAPNWIIPSILARKWLLSDLERLEFCISLYDYEVLDFLADKEIDLRSRSHIELSISYIPTGYYLPSSWWSGISDLTWFTIKDETDVQLSKLLTAQKLPSDALAAGQTACGPLGSIVKSVACAKSLKRRHVILPSSAKSVRLMGSENNLWRLVTAVKTKERTAPESPRVEAFTTFSTNLVRLELQGVLDWSVWLKAIPKSVKYLRVRADLQACSLNNLWLGLKVLILECVSNLASDSYSGTHYLPDTLRHLCISVPHDFRLWSYRHFKSLKTLFIASPTLRHARKVRKREVNAKQLDRFDIVYKATQSRRPWSPNSSSDSDDSDSSEDSDHAYYSSDSEPHLPSAPVAPKKEEDLDPDDKFVVVHPVRNLKRSAAALVDDYCRRIEDIWNDD